MVKRIALYSALGLSILLTACASPGTRVSSDSNFYKSAANSQQGMCTQFGCSCYMDGAPASCPLVSSCLNAGSCRRASQ